MTDVVTRLIVRGDGSLAVLDQFENKMEAAGKATDRATGAVANYEARMAKARAAMEAGNAISTQTVARRSAEQRAFEGLASSVDKSFALRIRLEREAERAAVSAANAVNMGYISQEQALSTLVALEQRHAAQMMQAATANDNLANSYRSSAAAAGEAAAASMRANAARSRTGGGVNQAHTTNLLFQAQDIAMMTAMGQAPMMLAMQQGMQVGGIFHQIGGGRQIVQALGSAIVGLLNPLNLATIATIALGAAGVQWFMSTMNGAEDATSALEKHGEMMDELLAGYKDVRSAAQTAFDAAVKLPEGVVASDLRATLREQADAQEEVQRRILANRDALAETADLLRQFQDIGTSTGGDPSAMDAGIRQIEMMRQLAIDTSSTRSELDAAAVAARELYNTSDDPALKDMADQAYQLAMQLMAIQAQADSASAALNAIPRSIQVRLEFNNAMGEISDLYMDPRSRFEVARENLENWASQATATAQTYSELKGVGDEYVRVLDSINAAEAQANEKAGRSGAKAAQKPFDQWGGNVEQFQQRIESQRMEIELLGQSTYEIERQKSAFDLLNQAKQAGIPITAEVTDQINLMSAEYAAATVELERQTEARRRATEDMNFYKSTVSSTVLSLAADLRTGENFWTAFGDAGVRALDKIADRALSMAMDGIWDMIFSAFGGGFGTIGVGGVGIPAGGFIPGLTGPSLPSFDGGGFTGHGNRSGGLDGKGGYLAMLHPRETVIDHTRQAANQNNGGGNGAVTVRLVMPDGWKAEIVDEARSGARQDTVHIVQENEKALQNYRQNGG